MDRKFLLFIFLSQMFLLKVPAAVTERMHESLVAAEGVRMQGGARTGVRRLTRAEYENTVSDLFGMPGIALAEELPVDGSAHGHIIREALA